MCFCGKMSLPVRALVEMTLSFSSGELSGTDERKIFYLFQDAINYDIPGKYIIFISENVCIIFIPFYFQPLLWVCGSSS